ncbi:hypothetical protein [Lysobacter auxotrophicus]|uniref:Uncharacterized protein n=1 Tax=Lysobacter auxotrophicus TaxID=2992573 RepID=A0ABM8DFZ8_9GAMM|nr:hypothetical protein [Lysobacter auxotrophicus]BDU17509.1 hypothetical protein LA521A_27100 [Lysobacter auxotrophicus]
MPTINRTLLLKRVVQVDGIRFPAIEALALHESMDRVFEAANSVWDRHYPKREQATPGRRCVFFERVERRGTAVLFNAYAYLARHTPDQAVIDDVRARVSADPIVDEHGTHKEIVERFAIIVLGETMIIESARVSGSAHLALAAMRDLIRRHDAPRHPNMKLEDAPSLDFQRMARLHRGVASVTARLHVGFTAEPNTFGDAMEAIVARKGFERAKVTTTIEASENDQLDPTRVEEMLDESESGTGLSGITIRFRDGASLGELSSYREKLPIQVQQVRPGVPVVTEIETAMVDYLRALATPDEDNFQLITQTGMFT